MTGKLIPAGTAERIRREVRERREARPPPEILRPEHYLEVGLSSDEREIVINLPDPPGADPGSHWITFSPLQARHLARLLLRKAEECKA